MSHPPDGNRPVIAVVGGGIAGLAAAWQLVADPGGGPTPEVVLVEAGPRVGGKLRSTEFCGRTVDLAADAFLARRPEATGLCEELGLTDQLVPVGASGASLWARGRLRPMPAGLNLGLPTRWLPLARSGILSPAGTLRAGFDLVLPHRHDRGGGDQAVGTIVDRRLGRQVMERLADPLIGGIHAGGVADLSAAATFPALLTADRQSGSLMRRLGRPPSPAQRPTPPPPAGPSAPMFWSLRGGTARLADELRAALVDRGVAVRTGVATEAFSRGRSGRRPWELVLTGGDDLPGAHPLPDGGAVLPVDGVVLAVPAGQAGHLLAPHSPSASTLLQALPFASVTVLTLSYPKGSIRTPLTGTGFLVPRSSPIAGRPALITGCTYLDRKWPHLAGPEDELIRLSVGRHGDTRSEVMDDDELVAAAAAELAHVLDVRDRPTDSVVTRWSGAFPQYPVGHLVRVAQIEEAVSELPGISVAGASYRGVGIPACVGSGRTAARATLATLAATAR